MADIIDLTSKLPHRDNLIVATPLEFRRGDWPTGLALMCTRAESARYETHRNEASQSPGHRHIGFVPNHFKLDGGTHYTVMALFRYRSDLALLRRVYRLAGLMECVTNAPSPVLRTDLLRRFYQAIIEERDALQVVWRGNARNFLLPLHPDYYNPNLFLHRIQQAESLKDLFARIEAETYAQLDVLSRHYVFYVPERFLALAP